MKEISMEEEGKNRKRKEGCGVGKNVNVCLELDARRAHKAFIKYNNSFS
jgi:hypothetical protein